MRFFITKHPSPPKLKRGVKERMKPKECSFISTSRVAEEELISAHKHPLLHGGNKGRRDLSHSRCLHFVCICCFPYRGEDENDGGRTERFWSV
ncbi:hypothetical protein CDAR_378321 [Caerostris darwini]|uniref:Ycf15 n=1 Tax=Caerostris darwini TaxID=1538125 RepID=A0AAV4T2E6_9ARAC|nr:hypothetical protein CDAR_378321 [Caerostris darwini]